MELEDCPSWALVVAGDYMYSCCDVDGQELTTERSQHGQICFARTWASKGGIHRLSLVLSWDFRLPGFCSFGKEA